MKKILIATAVSIMSLLFVACSNTSPVPKDVKFLNESEIKTLFNDKTAYGITSGSGKTYELKFNSNGTFLGMVGSNSVSGSWFVKNESKCLTMNSKDYCSKHYKLDGKYFTYNEVKNSVVPISFK
jgi:hypothetical protein